MGCGRQGPVRWGVGRWVGLILTGMRDVGIMSVPGPIDCIIGTPLCFDASKYS